MGALFCSYYINNKITRLRKAIVTSKINEIKSELKDYLVQCDQPNSSKSSSCSNESLVNLPIDSNGNTPLILAIESRQLKSFNFLLCDLNADPNKPNEYTYYTPLHICCLALPTEQFTKNFTFTNKSTVSKSLDNLNSPRTNKLMEVSVISNQSDSSINRNNRLRSDKKLLPLSKKKKIYASVDSAFSSLGTDSEGTGTAFGTSHLNYIKLTQKPIDRGTLSTMIELLAEKGADLNCLVKVNRLTRMPGFELIKYVSPLHVAVYNHNLTAIDLLLNLGSDPNQQDPISKVNALHMACYMSKIEIVSLLLENRAIDVEARSKNGFNCLHWLALSDNEENSFGIAMLIIAHILKKCESTNLTKSNDILNMFDQKVKLFVNEVTIDYMQTPLMFACMKNKLNLIKTLLDYDASVDLKDRNGLNAAYYGKNNESCLFLLNSFNKIKRITMKKKINNSANTRKSSSIEISNSDSLESRVDIIEQRLSAKTLERDSRTSNLSNAKSLSANDLYRTSF